MCTHRIGDFNFHFKSKNISLNLIFYENQFYIYILIVFIFSITLPPVYQGYDTIDILKGINGLSSHCEKHLDSDNKELFAKCATAVKMFLSERPFSLFHSSMYFHRYLQWKWLERYSVLIIHHLVLLRNSSIIIIIINIFLSIYIK